VQPETTQCSLAAQASPERSEFVSASIYRCPSDPNAIRAVPAGSTASYGEIAARIGEPKAVRSVAQACASNAIAVAIPCHRIVRRDGSPSGYRWGVERKRALLDREARR